MKIFRIALEAQNKQLTAQTNKCAAALTATRPTIIFDEIDTGVSGDIADRMGQVMKELSSHL